VTAGAARPPTFALLSAILRFGRTISEWTVRVGDARWARSSRSKISVSGTIRDLSVPTGFAIPSSTASGLSVFVTRGLLERRPSASEGSLDDLTRSGCLRGSMPYPCTHVGVEDVGDSARCLADSDGRRGPARSGVKSPSQRLSAIRRCQPVSRFPRQPPRASPCCSA